MKQTRLESLVEAFSNVAIGYGIAIASQLMIFPWFGIHVPLSSNLLMGFWFTLVSIVRTYALRRWFNARLHAWAHRVAGEKK